MLLHYRKLWFWSKTRASLIFCEKANPPGINFAVCFYLEPDEIVTSNLEISALLPQELNDAMSMPSCTYSVHSGAVDWPAIAYANVGETCNGSEMGMLVKKYFVTDGDGEDYAVIDHDGCSSDLSLLSEVTYEPTAMRAYAHSQAFRYADSNQLYFTCQIKMCQRQMKMCEGITVPKCDRPKSSTASSGTIKSRKNEVRRLLLGYASPGQKSTWPRRNSSYSTEFSGN